jgi:ABC-type transport system substrate-binding protein
MLSAVALAIGAGLLVAASLASPASSGTSGPAASAAGKARRGGTFRYSLATDIDYVDPGLAYYVPSWQILYATCRTLMQYPDAPAPRGGRLVPDGAASFPRVSRNGRVYTFTVRRGMRFSTGRPITAQNYAWAINRVLSKEMLSAGQPFYEQIVGAKAVTAAHVRLPDADEHALDVRGHPGAGARFRPVLHPRVGPEPPHRRRAEPLLPR